MEDHIVNRRALLLTRNYLQSAYNADPTISRRIIMGVNHGVFRWGNNGPMASDNAIPISNVVVMGRLIYNTRQRIVSADDISLRVLGDLSGFRNVENEQVSQDTFLEAVRAYIIGFRYNQTNQTANNGAQSVRIGRGMYAEVYGIDPDEVIPLKDKLGFARTNRRSYIIASEH